MANIKNIIGNKYGKLTVLELIDSNNKSKTRYLCKCECGNLHETSGDSLRGGKSKSCGCLKKAYIPKICDRKKNKDKTLISDDFILVNGIDRINSNIGYIEGNIVPCCKHCNSAKNTMTESEFKEWIVRLYNNYIK